MSKRLLVGLAGVLCVVPAFAAWDNFNRAELGDTWTIADGNVYIVNKKLHGVLGTSQFMGTWQNAWLEK